ncbi:MAG: hypothetical protein JOZ07_06780 [Solirubrobacterales bacterium]|nr:hypothetical protein [Solirubrobacterales bacterium]
MRRRYVISLIVVAIVVFLVISALLTRALSVGGAEEAAITNLVRAEARGDVAGITGLMHDCGATCRGRAAINVSALRRSGMVSILQITGPPGFALRSAVSTARVAWIVGDSLPRVQCVRVRRAGSVLDGFRIQLLVVSRRIRSDAVCPRSY